MAFRLFAFLCLVLLTSPLMLHAQQVAPAAPAATSAAPAPAAAPLNDAASAEDAANVAEIIKNTAIHPRPKDFAEAQQLALQNRGERLEMLNRSLACVQGAKTMEDLAVCQRDEGKSLAVIRLSYCDSTVSFPSRRQRTLRNAEGAPNTAPAEHQAVIVSECEKAIATITGAPPPGRDARRQMRQQRRQQQPAQ
jgi:hypothetical protein